MRYVKFWMVGVEDRLEGVRGFCNETETRYEISRHEDLWEALEVVTHRTDESWGFRRVAFGDLFACMAEVEEHAKAQQAAMEALRYEE